MFCSEFCLDLFIWVNALLTKVDGEHLTRSQAAPGHHICHGQVHHASFRPSNHIAIISHSIAHGTKTVTVHATNHPTAIGCGDGSWAIPRLHDGICIFIHGPAVFSHVGAHIGCFRYHDGLSQRRRTTRTHKQFKDGIKRRRIRRAIGDHGLQILSIFPIGLRCHAYLMAVHPIGVALDGVDFTIMGKHPEWLGQFPLGEGVGGITLVVNRKG